MLIKSLTRTATALAVLLLVSTFANAHPPTGIVVDSRGRLYFSDLETIWKLGPGGRLVVFRAGVAGRHVHELFIDSDGNVYGSDVGYDQATRKYVGSVWKMSASGVVTWLQEPSDNAKPGISIWVDRSGNMYSIDQNNHTKTRTVLLRRTPDGTVTTLAGGAYGHADGQGTAAKFSSVGGMTFGPDGNLYLTDGSTVRKVTLDGRVTTVARNLDFTTPEDQKQDGGLTGLAADSNGSIYVADTGRRRLLKVKSDGNTDVVYRATAPFFPNGVAVGRDGSIYVLEFGMTPPNINSGPRVRKILPDGKNVVLVTLGEQAAQTPADSSSGGAPDSNIYATRPDRILMLVALLGVGGLATWVWRHRHGNQSA
ncbi:MAG TPA: hypothetical protein VFX97_05890 [Pyrinomonadaceae bacterium]|nr:hypothetical protein [Pyrinomonadaceae bacterium]